MRGDWREYIASVKGCADLFAKERFVRNMSCFVLPFSFANPTEQTIIRTDEKLIGTLNDDCSTTRAHAGIDHSHMNRAVRKVFIAGEQVERRSFNVVRWNVVTDGDNLNFGIDRKDHALQRAHEIIVRAEVGKKSDDCTQSRSRICHLSFHI